VALTRDAGEHVTDDQLAEVAADRKREKSDG